MPVRGLYARHFSDPHDERALLCAVGFTAAFATARGITHAIKHGVGPFRNISAGGKHIHHSTFGIFGLITIGYLWAQQIFIGHDAPPRWGSRVTAASYGISAALTLDEFSLWLDLQDDYWSTQGRKSIDAVAIFGGLLTTGVIAREALDEVGALPDFVRRLTSLDIGAKSSTSGA
jgi:hypothetical protein